MKSKSSETQLNILIRWTVIEDKKYVPERELNGQVKFNRQAMALTAWSNNLLTCKVSIKLKNDPINIFLKEVSIFFNNLNMTLSMKLRNMIGIVDEFVNDEHLWQRRENDGRRMLRIFFWNIFDNDLLIILTLVVTMAF